MVFHRCGSFCVVSGLIFVRMFYHIDHTEKDARQYGFVSVLLKIVLLMLNFNCKIELQGCFSTVSDKPDVQLITFMYLIKIEIYEFIIY